MPVLVAFFSLQLGYPHRSFCLLSSEQLPSTVCPHHPPSLNSQYPVHQRILALPSTFPISCHTMEVQFDNVKHGTGVPISSLVLDFVVWTDLFICQHFTSFSIYLPVLQIMVDRGEREGSAALCLASVQFFESYSSRYSNTSLE